jgi:hypothetical protein
VRDLISTLAVTAYANGLGFEIFQIQPQIANSHYFHSRLRPHTALDRKTPDTVYFDSLSFAAAACPAQRSRKKPRKLSRCDASHLCLRSTMSLYTTAIERHSGDPTTKSPDYYKIYDAFFESNHCIPENMLEIGVYMGESTKIFADSFPDSRIVGADQTMRNIDFSRHKNVSYVQADQRNPESMRNIATTYFPDGIDFILDDASHIGSLSALTFNCLFPFLRSGGAYAIEDWGTGYWDTWFDGGRFQEFPLNFFDGYAPKRIPSHDYGMVGFVKSLVDLTHETAIKVKEKDVPKHKSRIKSLHFFEGICFAIKA